MLNDLLFKRAEQTPNAVFVHIDDRQITFDDMAQMVCAATERLRGAGISAGDKVAMICGNRPGFLSAWFALSELGAVCVPLNTGLRGDSMRYTLTQSESKAVLIDTDFLAQKQADLDALDQRLPQLVIDETYEQRPAIRVERAEGRPALDPSGTNSILYTSGTTGLPKGAMLPHSAYREAGIDMVASLGMTPNDRIMVFLPLFHANPQMYAVASTLTVGASMILIRHFSASRFFDDARRYGATGFTYVGTVLSIIEKTYPGEVRDHSIGWCVGGGAPLRVWKEISGRFGIEVRELYGMTETGGWVTMNTVRKTRLGSVGPERKSVKVRILDESGKVLPAGQKGEIVGFSRTGDQFFTGYWNNPKATADTLRDGWLHTGDRGWMDEDGYLFFDGRLKELIRRAGEMISPVEIEQQLLKHEAVADCAVVGIPDEILGEDIMAYVVVRSPVDAISLRDFLKQRLGDYMVPRYYGFIEQIPKTETQKIKRHEVVKVPCEKIDTRR